MILCNNDIPLLAAFLEREAKDFRYEGDKAEGWVSVMMNNVMTSLEKFKGKCNYIRIKSLTNAGLLSRELILTPCNDWAPEGDVVVILCTCGQLSCWGSVSYPKKARSNGILYP